MASILQYVFISSYPRNAETNLSFFCSFSFRLIIEAISEAFVQINANQYEASDVK